MEKRALIVITSHDQLGTTGKKTGWYLSEVSHVYFPLVSAGFQVDFASPKGGAAPMDEGSRKLEDAENRRFLEDPKVVAQLGATLPLSQVDPERYQVIHFAGGHGTMWDFPGDPDIQRLAAAIYDRGGIVAAVCHGPAALVDVKLKNGKYLVAEREVSGFTNAEEKAVGLSEVVPFALQSKLEARGAKFRPGANWADQVSVSERLITGQNPQSAKQLGRKIVEVVAALRGS